MPPRLRSRKFWLSLLGSILPILASYLTSEVDIDQAIKASSAIVVAYVLGQGYVDGQKHRANGGSSADPA
jgi:hypothetical protein